jgi:TolA-binding protein
MRAAPRTYRSRRRVLRRLVIPGVLAAIIAGAAIGAAASYLTSPSAPGAQQRPSSRTAPAGHAGPATPPTTAGPRPGKTAPATASPGTAPHAPPSSANVAEGRALNDAGYARIQQGDYEGAIPQLRRAVDDLRGAGPRDPYEAYANYNLGYALLQVGDCTGAMPPLEVANRLESSPLVDSAIRRASGCAHQGS